MVFTAGRGLIRSLPEKWKSKKTSWKSFSEVGIGTGTWATLFGVDFTSLIGTHFVFGSQRFKASGLVRKWKKVIKCMITVVNLWQGYNWLNCFSMYWINSLCEAFLSKNLPGLEFKSTSVFSSKEFVSAILIDFSLTRYY